MDAKLLLPLALLTACHSSGSEPSRPLPAVRVQTVLQSTGNAGHRYSASVLAAAKVDVAFRVGGYVDAIGTVKGADGKGRTFQEGDHVAKGDVLVRLRQNDFEQKLKEAKASLAEAKAALEQARLDDQRTQQLMKSNTIAPAEADAARIKHDVAKARYAAAEAKVAEATTAMGDASLRSPLDGLVLSKNVEVGTLVAPGTPAFVVADTDTVKVVFGVPDTTLGQLTIGSAQGVETEAFPGRTFTGKITRISPSADPKTRVFEVEIGIPNPQHELKVGMVASLSLTGSGAQPKAMLPLAAILRSPKAKDGFAVLVVDEKAKPPVAHLRDVQLGDFLGNMIPVLGGLEPTEKVVVQGASYVSDGEPVRVLADEALAGGQP